MSWVKDQYYESFQEESFISVYFIDCPKCGAKESIKVVKDSTPGYRETDYYPCKECNFQK